MFDGEAIYQEIFIFQETRPLSQNFEMFDYESKNFMTNSGSYFIMMLGIFMVYLIGYLVNLVAVFYSKHA